MKRTLLWIASLMLWRDRMALLLTFVMPIVFFSIFALIFGGMSFSSGGSEEGEPSGTKVILVDEDGSDTSRRFLNAVGELAAVWPIREREIKQEDGTLLTQPHDRATARNTIIEGRASAAVIVPADFGANFATFDEASPPLTILYDSANPVARMALPGLMQAAAMQAAPDLLMERGLGALEEFGGALTPGQRLAMETITPYLRGERPWGELDPDAPAGDASSATGFTGLVQVHAEAARQRAEVEEEDDGTPSMVAYYAAGISVMFLLFSMAGAGGSILQEEEYGTLERLLTANLTMGTILASNWLFFMLLGIAQVIVMFVWAALVFDLPLFEAQTLLGFGLMTVLTAAAAAAFGLFLATLCRTRAQLGGMSTIVILIMSALGGSMVPKFVAPAVFDITSRFTFNGWALDGYLAVFWYASPSRTMGEMIAQIGPSLMVLVGMTLVFLTIARALSRRWERG